MAKEKNPFEGVSIDRLEKALGFLLSTDEYTVKVKLTPKEEYKKQNSCKKLQQKKTGANENE